MKRLNDSKQPPDGRLKSKPDVKPQHGEQKKSGDGRKLRPNQAREDEAEGEQPEVPLPLAIPA
jgi:hypothetical protein